MSKSLSTIYTDALVSNAKAIEHLEQITKTLILLIPTRIGIKSEHAAQGAYSAVCLLGLYHKLILLKQRLQSQSHRHRRPVSVDGVKVVMLRPLFLASAVEDVSLFVEMYAGARLGGARAKWTAVTVVEAVRIGLQLWLYYLNKCDIVVAHKYKKPEQPFSTDANRVYNYGSSSRNVPLLRSVVEFIHIIKPLITRKNKTKQIKKCFMYVLVKCCLFVCLF